MFPTQYATNSSAPVTLRFVKPATLEEMTLSESGMLTAKTAPRARPKSRSVLSSIPSFHTSAMPTSDTTVFRIIMAIRVRGTKVATVAVMRRKTICAAPRGIWSRRDCSCVNPKLLIRIFENYSGQHIRVPESQGRWLTLVIPPLQRFTQNVYRTRNHVCGSRRHNQTCSQWNLPVSVPPGWFWHVRCRAMRRSLSDRKMAFFGVSGSKTARNRPMPAVMAPRTRNRSCQLLTVSLSTVPIPHATTPPMTVATQLPKNQADCLDQHRQCLLTDDGGRDS